MYKSRVDPDTFASVDAIIARGYLNLFLDEDGNPAPFSSEQRETILSELDWLRHEFGYDKQQILELRTFFPFMHESRQFMNRLETGQMQWRPLENEGTISTPDGSATLRCIAAPGHCHDHYCFILEEEQALLSGDHVLGHGTTVVFDMFDYMTTLENLVCSQPARLLPGHGVSTSNAMALLQRYVRHRRERELQVWGFLSARSAPEVHSAHQVAQALYPNTPSSSMHQAAQNCFKILFGLYKEGHLDVVCAEKPERSLKSYVRVGRLQTQQVKWRARMADKSVTQRMISRADSFGARAKL